MCLKRGMPIGVNPGSVCLATSNTYGKCSIFGKVKTVSVIIHSFPFLCIMNRMIDFRKVRVFWGNQLPEPTIVQQCRSDVGLSGSVIAGIPKNPEIT